MYHRHGLSEAQILSQFPTNLHTKRRCLLDEGQKSIKKIQEEETLDRAVYPIKPSDCSATNIQSLIIWYYAPNFDNAPMESGRPHN